MAKTEVIRIILSPEEDVAACSWRVTFCLPQNTRTQWSTFIHQLMLDGARPSGCYFAIPDDAGITVMAYRNANLAKLCYATVAFFNSVLNTRLRYDPNTSVVHFPGYGSEDGISYEQLLQRPGFALTYMSQ